MLWHDKVKNKVRNKFGKYLKEIGPGKPSQGAQGALLLLQWKMSSNNRNGQG